MGRRRSRRLQKKEIEKTKAKMSSTSSPEAVEPIIQNSPIFDPEIRDVLPKIINHLDPGSFVKLTRTCKEMNHICFDNKEIQISCWDMGSDIEHAAVVLRRNAVNCVLITTKYRSEYPADSDFMMKLSQMPFVYQVGLEINNVVDERILRELRRYFTNFPRVVIRHLQAPFVDDWEDFVEFIKDFRVDALHLYVVYLEGASVEAPPLEILSFLTQNLSDLSAHFYIPDDVILKATTEYLYIPKGRISKETFKELIKKFATGEILRWTIGRLRAIDNNGDSDDDTDNGEANEDEPDPFIAAFSEVMKTVQVEDIDEEAVELFTAYFTPSDPNEFSIVKSDGSLGNILVLPHCVEIGFGDL